MNYTESQKQIISRIYSVVPKNSIWMDELLKISSISFSEKIETACTNLETKEMILNENFIDEYCQSDEHLLMLILHELYHIIMGNILIPMSIDSNMEINIIILDSIINARLCKIFKEQKYVSFFEETYPHADSFPECILRPKCEETPEEFYPVLDLLYESNDASYEKVLKMLQEIFKNNPQEDTQNETTQEPLNEEQLSNIEEKYDEILSKKPETREQIIQEVNGKSFKFVPFSTEEINGWIAKIKDIFENELEHEKRYVMTSYDPNLPSGTMSTFMPSIHDRTHLSKTLLYENRPLLFNKKVSYIEKSKKEEIKTPIYLDVSFSMAPFLDRVQYLLSSIMQTYKFKLYAFSTDVSELPTDKVKKGKFSTRGGTDINALFKHYFSLKREEQSEKIFIITDQIFYENIKDEYSDKMARNDTEVHFWNIVNGWRTIYCPQPSEE